MYASVGIKTNSSLMNSEHSNNDDPGPEPGPSKFSTSTNVILRLGYKIGKNCL